MRSVAAAKFKANLPVRTDAEQKKGEPMLVTKHGEPVAKMALAELANGVDPLEAFRFPGVMILGDIMSPMHTDEEYEEFYQRSAEQLLGTSGE